MINKSHYISDGNTEKEQLYVIESALNAGQKWVQFRFKNTETKTRWKTAERVKELCDRYKAILIINDHIDIALAIDADGVHLGLSDAEISVARNTLKDKIIGGTANTFKQIVQRHHEGCDYIGLGPYAFTATKKELQPILGIEGFQKLQDLSIQQQISTPIIAIGGIQLTDIPSILKTGIHGIAFSGLLNESKHKKQTVSQLNQLLYGTI